MMQMIGCSDETIGAFDARVKEMLDTGEEIPEKHKREMTKKMCKTVIGVGE